jgi:hypothetical protein
VTNENAVPSFEAEAVLLWAETALDAIARRNSHPNSGRILNAPEWGYIERLVITEQAAVVFALEGLAAYLDEFEGGSPLRLSKCPNCGRVQEPKVTTSLRHHTRDVIWEDREWALWDVRRWYDLRNDLVHARRRGEQQKWEDLHGEDTGILFGTLIQFIEKTRDQYEKRSTALWLTNLRAEIDRAQDHILPETVEPFTGLDDENGRWSVHRGENGLPQYGAFFDPDWEGIVPDDWTRPPGAKW